MALKLTRLRNRCAVVDAAAGEYRVFKPEPGPIKDVQGSKWSWDDPEGACFLY